MKALAVVFFVSCTLFGSGVSAEDCSSSSSTKFKVLPSSSHMVRKDYEELTEGERKAFLDAFEKFAAINADAANGWNKDMPDQVGLPSLAVMAGIHGDANACSRLSVSSVAMMVDECADTAEQRRRVLRRLMIKNVPDVFLSQCHRQMLTCSFWHFIGRI